MKTHECVECRGPVAVDLVEVTTRKDQAEGVSRYLWGLWEECKTCGSTEQPRRVVDDEDLLTQPFDNQGLILMPAEQTGLR